MKRLLFVLLFVLSGCASKCNDYTIAYDCTAKYGTECRKHYLDMIEECLNDR